MSAPHGGRFLVEKENRGHPGFFRRIHRRSVRLILLLQWFDNIHPWARLARLIKCAARPPGFWMPLPLQPRDGVALKPELWSRGGPADPYLLHRGTR